jgi:hypothetical protein
MYPAPGMHADGANKQLKFQLTLNGSALTSASWPPRNFCPPASIEPASSGRKLSPLQCGSLTLAEVGKAARSGVTAQASAFQTG